MPKTVATEVASRELTDELEWEGAPLAEILALEVEGGFVFSYSGAVQAHGLYASRDGSPFPTVEAALVAARDLGCPTADFYAE